MKKNFLFLGFAIPDKEMKKVFELDKFPTIQTHKFNWNLIKGIEKDDICDFTYISSIPISDYPFFPFKKIKKNIWKINIESKNIKILQLPFINLSILKIITRFCSGLYYSIKSYNHIKNKGGVIVYSVHVPYMIIGYIIAKIYNIDYIGIWTDPPAVKLERENTLKSKLRRIENCISKFLMKKVSKVITLTKYLAEDFAPNKPYLVVEGIIDYKDINEKNTIKYKKTIKSNDIKIIYTGTLDKRYGIKNIVEGFKMANEKNFTLEIYGKGDYEKELTEESKLNKNIKYKGFVSNDKILDIQRNADYLINARSATDEYVKYSFPSKTLEYMISGTPVISTMLPGIPEEYKNYFFVLKDNNVKTICDMIKKLKNISEEERVNTGIKAQKFALNKNYIVQGKRIVNFIC
ncbi:glycosyltransferase [Clostridium perfringens]|uniref:glycosyltransferase n=1 Tax=Clostridium perfringens TaxID=1502 RepID=UPI0023F8EB8E|nr:glycosyltransferase [Clostridium perfringens]WEV22672.1 glycosyltransferase [Clostridium perfringens D]